MNVQAFLDNISFPKSLEELEFFAEKFDVEEILTVTKTEWTAPKWAMQGDIVFFFHAKTGIQWIRKLETKLKRAKAFLSVEKVQTLEGALKRARLLYKSYGGKIFAIGQVSDRPVYDNQNIDRHWNSKFYAEINQICVLQHPIDIAEFSHFLMVSRQSAITPVVGDDFEQLKALIATQNQIPRYLADGKAIPLPLAKISAENWLEVTKTYRRLFPLEIQFRRFYVDYFLHVFGEQKTFLSECECWRAGNRTGYADNAVKLGGKWCFVEVKLNIKAETHLYDQLKKYCQVEAVRLKGERTLSQEKIWQNTVLVIDTENICLYYLQVNQLTAIKSLDEVQVVEDIKQIREAVIQQLQEDGRN